MDLSHAANLERSVAAVVAVGGGGGSSCWSRRLVTIVGHAFLGLFAKIKV